MMSVFSGAGKYMVRSLRILIADDQPRARQSLKAVVTTWLQIQEVAEAQTGAEAIQCTAAWEPDVILMDARMPEVDGIQATRLIKARSPGIQIIVLSIYPEYRADALAAGADLFLSKADPPEHLLQALKKMAQSVHD